jgi:AcrR family transcriptional regulator
MEEGVAVGKQAATEVLAGAEGTGPIRDFDAVPPMPKLALVNSSKREQILTGMLEEVGSAGFEATSVRTVLARTGLYRQAFYDNFSDKDECYRSALDTGLARLESIVAAAAEDEEGWKGKLHAGLGALLDFLDSEADVGRALIVEVHAAGPEALERRTESMKRATDFIDLARREPVAAESPPRIAAEGIVAGIHAVVHSRLSTGAGGGFRELLPEFMYFAVLPYFGAEAATAEMQAARA